MDRSASVVSGRPWVAVDHAARPSLLAPASVVMTVAIVVLVLLFGLVFVVAILAVAIKRRS